MRQLVPYPLADVDLHERYATDWIDPGGVRVNFVSSVDGAATAAGKSEGLQTPGDNRVFAALRDLADVVVAGAGTVRGEGYAAIKLSERRRAKRAEYGLSPDLPTAIVSGHLDLDPNSSLFTETTDKNRSIVLTGGGADPDRRRALEAVADVVVCGDDELEPTAVRAALEERGLRRILCEGGPHLFSDLARTGVVDELCLSVSPLLAGPGPGRITAGDQWDGDPRGLTLAMLLEEDSALFARYLLS